MLTLGSSQTFGGHIALVTRVRGLGSDSRTIGSGQLQLRAVKPISGSHLNDGFRPDSGPSQGDPCMRALRPELPSEIGSMNGR